MSSKNSWTQNCTKWRRKKTPCRRLIIFCESMYTTILLDLTYIYLEYSLCVCKQLWNFCTFSLSGPGVGQVPLGYWCVERWHLMEINVICKLKNGLYIYIYIPIYLKQSVQFWVQNFVFLYRSPSPQPPRFKKKSRFFKYFFSDQA